MTSHEHALVELGRWLKQQRYSFITATPETHRRADRRAQERGHHQARDLRDVFGFSRPFAEGLLPGHVLTLLTEAGALRQEGALLRADVRFSSLGPLLLVHSAYPTNQPDAVFFGPDTYRYCRLLQHWLPAVERLVDIGSGSGAGGLACRERAKQLVLCDVNPRALALSRVNVELNEARAEVVHSDLLQQLAGSFDAIVANPPYMRDTSARVYRDGGGQHGEGLSVRIVREALPRLRPGGTLIVYTGAAVVMGQDCFLSAIAPLLRERGLTFDYEELDPDVFGEELDQPGYEQVERIAAVGLRVRAPG